MGKTGIHKCGLNLSSSLWLGRKPLSTFSWRGESRLPTDCLLVHMALQPSKGVSLPLSDPRTCVSNIWLKPLTHRAYIQPCNFPYILSPLPQAHVRTWVILFPAYPVPCGSFFKYVWECFCTFQLVFWANCSTCWWILFIFIYLFFSFEYSWFTMLCFRCTAKWFSFTYTCIWASFLAQLLKNHPTMKEIWVQSLGWEDMLRATWRASPGFLPGESHGQRA